MGQQGRSSAGRTASATGQGDAWTAFSLLFGGVAVYGGLGWLIDRWLSTGFFLPVGLLAGMAGALYLVYARFVRAADDGDDGTDGSSTGDERAEGDSG